MCGRSCPGCHEFVPHGLYAPRKLVYPLSFGQGYPAKLGMPYAIQDVLLPTLRSVGCGHRTGTKCDLCEDPSSRRLLPSQGKHILTSVGALDSAITPLRGVISTPQVYLFRRLHPVWIQRTSSGLGYADFLLGAVSSWNASYTPIRRPAEEPQYRPDDFKQSSPEPDSQLGLRYERQAAGTRLPTALEPSTLRSQIPDGNAGAMWIARPAVART